jgi:hypothetical protein
MTGYTASVALDVGSHTALVSSPRGHLLTLWDFRENRLLESFDVYKPYGVARSPQGDSFAVSTAGSGLFLLDAQRRELRPHTPDAEGSWDNHLLWQG